MIAAPAPNEVPRAQPVHGLNFDALQAPKEFPLPADLPGADFLRAVAEEERVPLGLVGTIALGIISACCGASVEVIGAADNDWRKTGTNLFLGVSMPSGGGKSNAFRRLMPPLWAFQKKRKLDAVGKAPWRFIVDDATPEAVAAAFGNPDKQTDQPFVASISEDARSALANVSGRYSADHAPNRGIFLKGFSREPFHRDRVTRPSVYIERAVVSVLWLFQEDIRPLLTDSATAGDGLLSRFLIASFPAGDRTVPLEPRSAGADRGEWDATVANRGDYFHALVEPQGIKIAAGVFELLARFHNLMAADAQVPSWFAIRAREQSIRVAGCLHAWRCGRDSFREPLDIKTAAEACLILQWFATHVRAIREEEADRTLTRVQDFLRRHQQVTARQIYRGLHIPPSEVAVALEKLAANSQAVAEMRGTGKTATQIWRLWDPRREGVTQTKAM